LVFCFGVATGKVDVHDQGAELMSLGDKVSGRVKQAVGDLTGDKSTEREGKKEERKGEAKDQLAGAQERVEDKASEVSDLERKT
jgi:uncharacterized protein YjbJ (UPF0337 family)